jgi:arylsulfatase A-like enzyme
VRDAVRVRFVVAAIAVGLLLGMIDLACHADTTDLAANSVLAMRGAVRVLVLYGAFCGLLGLIFPWRTLVGLAVSTFVVAQGAAWWVNHGSEDPWESATVLAALAVASLGGTFAARWILRSHEPRWPLFAIVPVVILAGISWLLPAHNAPSEMVVSHAKAPAVLNDLHAPNIVILTLDTLRPDRLGTYGYAGIRTPNLDVLAAGGAVFLHALAAAPFTPPSHASIFTGVYPTHHGVRGFEGQYRLLNSVPTLAEILHGKGYSTGAVVAAAPVAPGWGLERGFDWYDFAVPSDGYPFYAFRDALLVKILHRLQIVPDRWAYRSAEDETDHAIKWIDQQGAGPFFLWVHYFDAHTPPAPPSRFMQLAAHPGSSMLDLFGRSYLYDSSVAYVDEQIGRLVGELERRGLLEHTILVCVSDHGEGLGEHGFVGHSFRVYEEQDRVALLLRYPARIPAGRRIASQVRAIDVMPTLLDLLGIPIPSEVQGESLLSTLDADSRPTDRLAFTETFQDPKRRLVAVSDGRDKLILSLDTQEEALFALKDDPREQRDLVDARPEDARRLRTQIDAYLSDAAESRDAGPIDETVRRRLRALGYLN